jgi:hypothetical protein
MGQSALLCVEMVLFMAMRLVMMETLTVEMDAQELAKLRLDTLA